MEIVGWEKFQLHAMIQYGLEYEWPIYRVTFLTGPALKVLSVGDGKIPTKKVKV